ncbi:MAG: hypothetical protein GY853_09675 [PVC group bacterium]|nr:hypothetical protein [PVC group bacterium]
MGTISPKSQVGICNSSCKSEQKSEGLKSTGLKDIAEEQLNKENDLNKDNMAIDIDKQEVYEKDIGENEPVDVIIKEKETAHQVEENKAESAIQKKGDVEENEKEAKINGRDKIRVEEEDDLAQDKCEDDIIVDIREPNAQVQIENIEIATKAHGDEKVCVGDEHMIHDQMEEVEDNEMEPKFQFEDNLSVKSQGNNEIEVGHEEVKNQDLEQAPLEDRDPNDSRQWDEKDFKDLPNNKDYYLDEDSKTRQLEEEEEEVSKYSDDGEIIELGGEDYFEDNGNDLEINVDVDINIAA